MCEMSESNRPAWYADDRVVSQLPFQYRVYAWYCRSMVNPATGVIRGGSFLHRIVSKMTRLLRLRESAGVTVGNIVVHLDLCDSRIFMVFGELSSSSGESRIMRLALHEGDSFIDVGANHGSFSLIARTFVGSLGSVVAFEPQPRLATLLGESFRANGFHNCRVYNLALSDRAGETEFYIPSSGSGSSGIYRSFSATGNHHQVRVKTQRLDDVLDWRNLPGNLFVKLDVEGSEMLFLAGAQQMIRSRRPIILFEINPTSARAAGYSAHDLLLRFSDYGYRQFADIDHYPAVQPLTGIDCTRQRNILALPSPS